MIIKKVLYILFVLLLLSCTVDINYRLYEKRVDLPLMGAQTSITSLNFYAVKKVPLEVLKDLHIQDAYFNFTTNSTKSMSFKVMVQDTGPDDDLVLYATCSPIVACSGIYAVYKKTPDYIIQSPILISGSVDGEKTFKNVIPDDEAIVKIEKAFEKGWIWVIVNVSTTQPLYFQNDSLHIIDLEGVFHIQKDMSTFSGFLGGVF